MEVLDGQVLPMALWYPPTPPYIHSRSSLEKMLKENPLFSRKQR